MGEETTRPKKRRLPIMRIELMTLGLLDPRSNQLSYIGPCDTAEKV